MSNIASKTHTHLARDGLYYGTYQELRNANVSNNERRLKELGLDKMKQIGKRGRSSPQKRKAAPTTPPRRSSRVRNVTPERFGLDEDPVEVASVKRAQSKRKRSPAMAALSEEDRNTLEKLPGWVDDMEKYLIKEENLSRPNLSSVMRQVAKMSTGVGITYSRWNDNVAFGRGKPINLSEDLDILYDEAVEFEGEHGRDLGNGKSLGRDYWFIVAVF